MFEQVVNYISDLSPFWIYVTLFIFAFIENPFPPSPSDLVVVFGATLIPVEGSGISFIPLLLITTFGSSLGFMVMYLMGKYFGERVIRAGKLKFISKESMDNTDKWFGKYGYKLILANRFMPGTRSVISFFSGISECNFIKTFIYATISAFAWNLLVIYLGLTVGNNIKIIDKYLTTYSNIIMIVTILAIIIFAVRYFLKRKSNKAN